MSRQEKVRKIILDALTALNEERDEDEKIPVGPDTVLFGPDAELDSLALVSVIVDIETAVSDEFDIPVSATDDRAISQDPPAFTSVPILEAYIVEVLGEAE